MEEHSAQNQWSAFYSHEESTAQHKARGAHRYKPTLPSKQKLAKHQSINKMALANGQWFALIPKFGGFISLIASALVVRDLITQTWHHRVIPLTPAITLGKCVSCCMFSFFGPFMSTWMAPVGDAFYALGNTTSCTIQGFLVTFSIVSFVAYFIALVAVRKFTFVSIT